MKSKRVIRGYSGEREIDYNFEKGSFEEISLKTREKFPGVDSIICQDEIKDFLNKNLVNWNHKYQVFYSYRKSFRAAVKDIIDLTLEEMDYSFNQKSLCYLKQSKQTRDPHPEFRKLDKLMTF